MDKIITLANELKAELDSLPLFQEYKRVDELVRNDKELNDLKREIALAKAHHNDELHSHLLAKYNNHPLIKNLEVLKSDVYNYLSEVSEIINKKWWKFTSFFL